MAQPALHKLFGDNPISRYLQVADLLRGRISRGQWRAGDRLNIAEATQPLAIAAAGVEAAAHPGVPVNAQVAAVRRVCLRR